MGYKTGFDVEIACSGEVTFSLIFLILPSSGVEQAQWATKLGLMLKSRVWVK